MLTTMTGIMVMKKGKSDNKILFIDATNECIKVTNNNKLSENNIDNILKVYTDRCDVQYVAKLVPNSEVEAQDYNLSVSTYVEQEDKREITKSTNVITVVK